MATIHPLTNRISSLGYPGRVLVGCSFGWMLLAAGRNLLPLVLPNVIASLAITPFKAGIAVSVLFGVFALVQYPSGKISDKVNRKVPIMTGIFFSVVGLLILYFSSSYLTFLFGAFVTGLGIGLYPTAAQALLSDLFRERQGFAYGMFSSSRNAGGMLAAVISVVLLVWLVLSWRAVFLTIAVPLVAVFVVLHFLIDEPYQIRWVDLELRETSSHIARDKRLRRYLLSFTLFLFTMQGFVSFLPTYLQVSKGFSPSMASLGFFELFVVGVVVKPISGTLGDRLSYLSVAALALGVGFVGLGGMLMASNHVLVFLSIAVFAIGVMSVAPVMLAYLVSRSAAHSVGGDLGSMRTVYMGIGSLGPTYVGYVGGRFDFSAAYLGLSVTLLFSLFLILLVRRLDNVDV